MQETLPEASPRKFAPGRAATALALLLVAFSAFATYRNSLPTPFLFDDIPSILGNPSLRSLTPLYAPLLPPPATSLTGRPVANLSFALNYAVGGTEVAGYHAANLLIHVLCAWVLFGLVRRTLLLPSLRERFGADSLYIATAAAVVWAVHPLATEAVTYVIQRVESLVSLFYLLTLYGLVRSTQSNRRAWESASIVACLLGMATKEVMATAPLAALLLDRTFLAGSFAKAIRERLGYYMGLATTWFLLAILVGSTGWSRAGTAGFGGGTPLAAYWTAQFQALARYLELSVWPGSLTFDYGTAALRSPGVSFACAFVIVPLVAAVGVALVRRPALGFLGGFPLLVLAPTCVVPVITQTVAEHRMYLPLAAVVVLAIVVAYSLAGRWAFAGIAAAAVALGVATERRNEDYRSEAAIWGDTVLKAPSNARAHCALGIALLSNQGSNAVAVAELRKAVELEPYYPLAETELGIALKASPGNASEAIVHFRNALRMDPGYALAHFQLGLSLAESGQSDGAIEELGTAARLDPKNAEAHNNLGVALCVAGRLPEGIAEMRTALRLRPDFEPAHFDLGCALEQLGRHGEAASEFEAALALKAGDPAALQMLRRSRGK